MNRLVTIYLSFILCLSLSFALQVTITADFNNTKPVDRIGTLNWFIEPVNSGEAINVTGYCLEEDASIITIPQKQQNGLPGTVRKTCTVTNTELLKQNSPFFTYATFSYMQPETIDGSPKIVYYTFPTPKSKMFGFNNYIEDAVSKSFDWLASIFGIKKTCDKDSSVCTVGDFCYLTDPLTVEFNTIDAMKYHVSSNSGFGQVDAKQLEKGCLPESTSELFGKLGTKSAEDEATLFYIEGCSYCATTRKYLADNGMIEKFKIVEKEVQGPSKDPEKIAEDRENARVMLDLLRDPCEVTGKRNGPVPVLYYSGKCYVRELEMADLFSGFDNGEKCNKNPTLCGENDFCFLTDSLTKNDFINVERMKVYIAGEQLSYGDNSIFKSIDKAQVNLGCLPNTARGSFCYLAPDQPACESNKCMWYDGECYEDGTMKVMSASQPEVIECDSCKSCTQSLNSIKDSKKHTIKLTKDIIVDAPDSLNDGEGVLYWNNQVAGLSCVRYDSVMINDLVFDCQGHTLYGKGSRLGIYLTDTEQGVKFTIRNCNIASFMDGIYTKSGSLVLENSILKANSHVGINYNSNDKYNANIHNTIICGSNFVDLSIYQNYGTNNICDTCNSAVPSLCKCERDCSSWDGKTLPDGTLFSTISSDQEIPTISKTITLGVEGIYSKKGQTSGELRKVSEVSVVVGEKALFYFLDVNGNPIKKGQVSDGKSVEVKWSISSQEACSWKYAESAECPGCIELTADKSGSCALSGVSGPLSDTMTITVSSLAGGSQTQGTKTGCVPTCSVNGYGQYVTLRCMPDGISLDAQPGHIIICQGKCNNGETGTDCANPTTEANKVTENNYCPSPGKVVCNPGLSRVFACQDNEWAVTKDDCPLGCNSALNDCAKSDADKYKPGQSGQESQDSTGKPSIKCKSTSQNQYECKLYDSAGKQITSGIKWSKTEEDDSACDVAGTTAGLVKVIKSGTCPIVATWNSQTITYYLPMESSSTSESFPPDKVRILDTDYSREDPYKISDGGTKVFMGADPEGKVICQNNGDVKWELPDSENKNTEGDKACSLETDAAGKRVRGTGDGKCLLKMSNCKINGASYKDELEIIVGKGLDETNPEENQNEDETEDSDSNNDQEEPDKTQPPPEPVKRLELVEGGTGTFSVNGNGGWEYDEATEVVGIRSNGERGPYWFFHGEDRNTNNYVPLGEMAWTSVGPESVCKKIKVSRDEVLVKPIGAGTCKITGKWGEYTDTLSIEVVE